jgi:hypothetical protein
MKSADMHPSIPLKHRIKVGGILPLNEKESSKIWRVYIHCNMRSKKYENKNWVFAITDAWPPSRCLQHSIAAEKILVMGRGSFNSNAGGGRMQLRLDCHEFGTPGDQTSSLHHRVTAPIMRYHPAIVAQAFATMAAIYPGRVGIGVITGEPPNEMAVYGGEWLSNNTRLEMLEEAPTVMNRLWTERSAHQLRWKVLHAQSRRFIDQAKGEGTRVRQRHRAPCG